MNTKILCVDDDENLLTGLQRALRKQFQLEVAVGGPAGLQKLAQDGPYGVVVADMQMPGMNGIEFLKEVESRCRDTVRLMLTGNADQKTAIDAVNDGHVFRFLTKPCPPEKLATILTAALQQHRLITAERDLLENTLSGAIGALTEILSLMKPRLNGSPALLRERIRLVSLALQADAPWEIEVASMLAQVGYVTLSPAIILKSSAGMVLAEAEKAAIAGVPEVSANLVAKIPRLENVSRIIRYARRDFKDTALPAESTGGRPVPMGAHILRVLQDLGQMEAGGAPLRSLLEGMRQQAGVYDPAVLDAALRVVTKAAPAGQPATAGGGGERVEIVKPAPGPAAKPQRDDDPVSVLLVDDKPAIVDQARAGLADMPWRIVSSFSTQDAMSILGQEAIDIMLLSLSLPSEGAFTFIQNLRAKAQTKSIPVFALAVKTAATERARAQQLGIASIISKPIDYAELKRKICQALNLDSTHHYFQIRESTLVLTLPSPMSQTVVDAVFLHLRNHLNEAVEAGMDKFVLDLSALAKMDPEVVELVISSIHSSHELGLRYGVVSCPAFEAERKNFKETENLNLAATVEEAMACLATEQKAA